MSYELIKLQNSNVNHFLQTYMVDSYEIIGDLFNEIYLHRGYFSSLNEKGFGTIAFHKYLKNETYENARKRLEAACQTVVLILKDFKECKPKPSQVFVVVENPEITMCKLMRACSIKTTPQFIQTFPIDCYVGPNVHIEEGAVLGSNVCIEGNTYIYARTVIGNNVVIKPNTVIGGEGYQHSLIDDRLVLWPHLAGIVIGNDVHIGSNVCIDAGLFTDTLIQDGCHIDNLCHIAHSVNVGKNVSIVASCMIAGSVQIGPRAWISPASSILNGAHIGANAYVGMGSVVVKPVPDGTLVYGVPASPKGTN